MRKLTFRSKTISLIFFVGILFVFFMGDREAQAFWKTGGPYGGYVNSLAMAPTDPDIIYAATESGMFKTVNGRETWIETGRPEVPVRVVKVDPSNPNIVYAVTDDGIYRSSDGGTNWIQKGPLGEKVNAIAIDPVDPRVLYAGTGDDDPGSQTIGKIFKSTDEGETWHEKLSYRWINSVEALLIDPDNSAHIYAGAYGTYGFWKSIDGGENWGASKVPNDVYALAMTPASYSPDAIYAMGRDLYKSTNGGVSWVELTNAPPNQLAIAVDPNNPNVIYSGNRYFGGRFYKSTDAGDTWSVKANGLPRECRPSSIVIDPDDSTVYVGLIEGGVYKSTDKAETWNNSSQGLNNAYVENLAVSPTSPVTVYAAVKGEGCYLARTTNGGASWDYLPNSYTNQGAVTIVPQDSSTIYTGIGWALRSGHSYALKKSEDEGKSWTRTGYFLIVSGVHSLGISDIWVKPSDSNTILAAVMGDPRYGANLYKSTDAGQTWQWDPGRSVSVTTLAADPANPDVIYFGTEGWGYVIRSPDGGVNWTNISHNFPEFWVWEVRDIEVDLNSHVYAATDEGLMKWDGLGWTGLTGLPTDNITALAIDRSTSPGTVYAGTGEGVFVSSDGGSTWIPFSQGLGNHSITKLAISVSQPKILYAGTAYGGVWSRRLSSVAMPWIPLLLLDD